MNKRKLVPSKSFLKAYKKFVTKRLILKGFIETALIKLEEGRFSPYLKSHLFFHQLYFRDRAK
jgi:hypothetical protein